MYQIDKQKTRDRKRQKARHGMREDGRSVKYIQRIQQDKAERIKRQKARERKEAELDN